VPPICNWPPTAFGCSARSRQAPRLVPDPRARPSRPTPVPAWRRHGPWLPAHVRKSALSSGSQVAAGPAECRGCWLLECLSQSYHTHWSIARLPVSICCEKSLARARVAQVAAARCGSLHLSPHGPTQPLINALCARGGWTPDADRALSNGAPGGNLAGPVRSPGQKPLGPRQGRKPRTIAQTIPQRSRASAGISRSNDLRPTVLS
jgi:hypothetical protein